MKTIFLLFFFTSTSQNPFHYSHSEDFPLFSEPQIISLLLQKASPLLGFKTKGRGQVGVREGGRKREGGREAGVLEDRRRRKEIHGGKKKEGQAEGKRPERERERERETR